MNGPADQPSRGGYDHVASFPSPEDVTWISNVLREQIRWSAFWDKRSGVWRVAEDDPDSVLYAESADAGEVIGYIQRHS